MKFHQLVFILSSLPLPVIAADITWDQPNANNNWNTTDANWAGGATFATNDNVIFNSATGETVTVQAGGVTAGTIEVGTNNGTWTFSGGSITSGALTKNGTGTLNLNAANSFSSVALNAGALTITNIGALGSGTLTVGSGAKSASTEGGLGGSGSPGNFLFLSGIGSGTFATAINLPNDTSTTYRKIAVQGGSSGTYNFSGVISGGGTGTTLYFDSATGGDAASIYRLSNTNTFVGKVEFNRGSLQIDSDAALGGSSNQLIADGFSSSKVIFNYTGNYTHATSILTNTNFEVGGTNTISASGAFSGNMMTKVGTGTLTFASANSYGATVVSAGTLALSGSGTLGGTSSAVTVNGGILDLGTKSISAGAVTFGGGTVQNGTLTGTSYTSTGGTVSATLAGTGKLTHSGTGALTLSGPNSYSGGTAINGGPASNSTSTAGIIVTHGSALGTGAVTLGNTGSIAAIYTNGTNLTLANNIALSSSAVTTALIGKNATTQTYSGVLSGGNVGATLFINMDAGGSDGVLKLANTANTFTANRITTNRGVLAITADGSLGAAANTLYLDNTSLNGGLRFDADNINITHPVQFNDYARINVNSKTGAEISSNITGSAGDRGTAYTISGGTLTLSGTNTFYHKLDVASGATLKLGNASALGTTAAGATDGTNVSSGGVLDLNGQAVGAETITLNGTGISSGGALVNNSGTAASLGGAVVLATDASIGGTGDTTLSGVVSGAFGLTKTGTSTLTLTNSNTYSGQTNINEGTLELSNGNAIANAGVVSIANVAGATLKLNANETIGSLAGGGATGGSVNLQGNTLTSGIGTDTVFAGTITGSGGSLIKQGAGSLTLSGTSTYTGGTTVSVGTLLVTGALGNTAVVVNNGATIGGNGTIGGALNLDSGAMLLVTVGSPLSVTGNVSFDGFGFSNISGWDYQNAAIGEYTLISGSNFTFDNVSNFGSGNALTLLNGNKIYFDSGSLKAVVAIPEPSAALLGGLGVLGLLRRRRP